MKYDGMIVLNVNFTLYVFLEQKWNDFHLLSFHLFYYISASVEIQLQQIKALLQNVGSSFCPDHSDWSGDSHSRTADRSVLSKFLQTSPTDFSTSKLQAS